MLYVHPELIFDGHTAAFFKTKTVRGEFDDDRLQLKLRQAFKDFVRWFYYRHDGIPIMITDILRNDPKSDHDYSRGKAIDIRTKFFSCQVCCEILNWWLERHPRKEQLMKDGVQYTARSAYAHDSGQGFHIHLSID